MCDCACFYLCLCAGRAVWTPSCLGLWLRSTKPVSPVALCRVTSNSWRTSRASATTSSRSTSARSIPVRCRALGTGSLHAPVALIFYISKQTKRLTSSAFSFWPLCLAAYLLFVSAVFLTQLLFFWPSAGPTSSSWCLLCVISLQVPPHLFRKPWMPTSRN